MPLKKKYVETEAAHSGDEASRGGSDGEADEYEKGSFVVSDDAASESAASDDDAPAKSKPKKLGGKKRAAGAALDVAVTTKEKKPREDAAHKPQGNKALPARHVPEAPAAPARAKKAKVDFHFSIVFTNARFAQSFWEVACKALPHLFFHLVVRDEYAGLRLEAYDNPTTMAIKSVMECIVREGVDEDGRPLERAGLDGQSFCVSSKELLACFKCAQIKDAPLRVTKMWGQDGVRFEAMTNEEDVRAVYFLPFLVKQRSNILQRISTDTDVHVRFATDVLKNMATIGALVDSPTIRLEFALADATDDADTVLAKLSFSFPGSGSIHGKHSFILGVKKRATSGGAAEYEPVTATDDEVKWRPVSTNAYATSKFRVFVSNLDTDGVTLHLSTATGKVKPLVIIADSTETGACATAHSIFISPTAEDEDED